MSAKRKYSWGFSYAKYPQPTIEALQKQAEQTLRKAGEKSRQYQPVHVTGTPLCRHWWGKAWCKAIESYSDISNRLARGRRYLKADTVLDLQLAPGEIHALVQGSRVRPYKVHITLRPLSDQIRKKIEEACVGSLPNMEALLNGELPPAVADVFTQEGGLFPRPWELKIRCSCPDDAILCKHAAAVLYGVGVRIDENPFLFFQLRGISVEKLIGQKLESRVEEMLSHAHDAPQTESCRKTRSGSCLGYRRKERSQTGPDGPFRSQMSACPAISKTGLLLCRTKLPSDISRLVRAVSEFLPCREGLACGKPLRRRCRTADATPNNR